jgi:intracellular multiplication protein IcmK
MSADQVRELMQEIYRRNMATRENSTNRPPARAVTSLHTLDLSPGATPPVVRVAVGQGSVLSFADAAGRPWEIVDNINFNGNAFDVRLIGPHLYTIALREPSAANISIVLKDLPRPIVITAVPAQNEVDYLVEFTVPRFLGGQPPANALVTAADPSAPVFNAQTLLGYLYRTPPRDAVALRVEGLPGVQAWQSSPNTMVIRTDGMVMLPAWLRRHVSTDGMAVYEVPLSPVVSISQNGQVHRGALSGFVVSTATSAGAANVSQVANQAGGRP